MVEIAILIAESDNNDDDDDSSVELIAIIMINCFRFQLITMTIIIDLIYWILRHLHGILYYVE